MDGEDFLIAIVAIVMWWFILKGLYYLLLIVWKEVSPVVLAIGRAIRFVLYLPFAPFVSLWRLVFGYPETDEDRRKRQHHEMEMERYKYDDEKRSQDLQMVNEALRKSFEDDDDNVKK